MGGSAAGGKAAIKLNASSVPEATAWRKTDSDKYVGGYPVAATVAVGANKGADDVEIDFDTAAKK